MLSTEEKVFLVEHYFRSYGLGRQSGPSIKFVREQFSEHFNKQAPSNAIVLNIITKFRRTGSVLHQGKGKAGRKKQWLATKITNVYSIKLWAHHVVVNGDLLQN